MLNCVGLALALFVIAGFVREPPGAAAEVQRRIDRAKARRWPVLVSLLQDQRRCMGDLWVITASHRVAAWARTACRTQGPGGTQLQLEPIVLCLSPGQVHALLDEGHPSLAFFAAWAMQDQHGTEAVEVIERALSITNALPEPLRQAQKRDILNVLNQRLLAVLKERIMVASDYEDSRWVKEFRKDLEVFFRNQIKAEGKQEALLAVLAARGLPISQAEQAMVVRCKDLPTLERWLVRAVSAPTTEEALARDPDANGAPPAAQGKRRRRSSRSAARTPVAAGRG